MYKLFGTNGVRGVFGKDLTLEMLNELSMSVASLFSRGDTMLIGYDGRHSSEIISKIVSASLNAAGLNTTVGGLVPTPCLQYCTKYFGMAGGIMITASHNPPEYNGIKPNGKNGVEISREQESLIERTYFEGAWKYSVEGFGRSANILSLVDTYIDGILRHVDHERIRCKIPKVVLDLGNGVQSVAAPELCRKIGCQVITINEKVDGEFPGRGSEPTPENLDRLSKTVVENDANLGVAFDGDGDRCIICDEKGQIQSGDRSALLLSDFLLQRHGNDTAKTIVTTFNSTSKIDQVAKRYNSQVIRTKVGSVEVSRKMLETNALIGFEENGGFMFGKHNQVRDGAMTMALVLDLLCSPYYTSYSSSGDPHSLSEIASALPESFTAKTKVVCHNMEKIQNAIKSLREQSKNFEELDGIKIHIDDSSWVMVRPSGTEPIARIYAESQSESKTKQILKNYKTLLESYLFG